MSFKIKNAFVYDEKGFIKKDLYVFDGKISFFEKEKPKEEYDCEGMYVFPGFCDVHVHLREPGFSYKETIKTGTMAAAKGGYTTVFSMPNLSPVPDCFENLEKQLDIIKKDAVIEVIPYGSITVSQKGEKLSEMEEMADFVCAYTDDGKGVQNEDLMYEAMKKAASLDKIIAAHCEDESLLNKGYIHAGKYAKEHNHRGIVSESEYLPIEKNLETAKKANCKYHVCHVSAKESIELIRQAKKKGIDVTCETGPHYLVLCDEDLQEDGRFKMNPPLRSKSDKEALIEGIKDGTVDMIATDHAPHSEEEKGKGLENSLMGITGIETAFSVLYTELVKKGIITLERLIELITKKPRERFSLPSSFKEGESADFCVWDLEKKVKIDEKFFISKGKASPFLGKEFYGKCKMTIYKGEFVWQENMTEK